MPHSNDNRSRRPGISAPCPRCGYHVYYAWSRSEVSGGHCCGGSCWQIWGWTPISSSGYSEYCPIGHSSVILAICCTGKYTSAHPGSVWVRNCLLFSLEWMQAMQQWSRCPTWVPSPTRYTRRVSTCPDLLYFRYPPVPRKRHSHYWNDHHYYCHFCHCWHCWHFRTGWDDWTVGGSLTCMTRFVCCGFIGAFVGVCYVLLWVAFCLLLLYLNL